jgi:lipid-binding SYLF domain-containing protein
MGNFKMKKIVSLIALSTLVTGCTLTETKDSTARSQPAAEIAPTPDNDDVYNASYFSALFGDQPNAETQEKVNTVSAEEKPDYLQRKSGISETKPDYLERKPNTASTGSDEFAKSLNDFKAVTETNAFFNTAYGYALFPTVGKVGLGIGGAYGKGRVYKNGQITGKTELFQGSFGFQFGGQAFQQIIFFQDKRAYDEFTSGNFEFGAQASAAAFTAGAHAEMSTKGASATTSMEGQQSLAAARYYKGMAVFTLVKAGLMYEASLSGQTFTFEPR